MIVPGLGRNRFSSIQAMRSGVSIILETETSHLLFNSNTLLPLHQRPEDRGRLCSFEVFFRALGGTTQSTTITPQQHGVSKHDGQPPAAHTRCMLRSVNNTSEKATVAEMEHQRAQIQDSRPEEDNVAEMERRRVHILDRPQ